MADQRLTQKVTVGTTNDADEVHVVQSGVSKRQTKGNLLKEDRALIAENAVDIVANTAAIDAKGVLIDNLAVENIIQHNAIAQNTADLVDLNGLDARVDVLEPKVDALEVEQTGQAAAIIGNTNAIDALEPRVTTNEEGIADIVKNPYLGVTKVDVPLTSTGYMDLNGEFVFSASGGYLTTSPIEFDTIFTTYTWQAIAGTTGSPVNFYNDNGIWMQAESLAYNVNGTFTNVQIDLPATARTVIVTSFGANPKEVYYNNYNLDVLSDQLDINTVTVDKVNDNPYLDKTKIDQPINATGYINTAGEFVFSATGGYLTSGLIDLTNNDLWATYSWLDVTGGFLSSPLNFYDENGDWIEGLSLSYDVDGTFIDRKITTGDSPKSVRVTTFIYDKAEAYTYLYELDTIFEEIDSRTAPVIEHSADSADDASASYSQTQVQGILDELRDLKTKMRDSGILEVV